MLDFALKLVTLLAVGLVSMRLRLVRFSGFLASLALGAIVLFLGGWGPFLVILFFHLFAGALTKFRYDLKSDLGFAEEKGGARGWTNVLANGLGASLAVALEFATREPAFVLAFVGCVATGLADTAATEIGLLSNIQPRLITRLGKRVPAGTSGGVTPLGYAAAMLTSLSLGLFAASLSFSGGVAGTLLDSNPELIVASGFLGGVFGTTVDSLLGASVQGLYQCTVCMRSTDRKDHCGRATTLKRGSRRINNHFVNFVAIAAAFVLSAALLWLLRWA